MDRNQIEALRRGIDALVRVFKIADVVQPRDGGRPLNPSDVQALMYVDANEGCNATNVAQFLGMPPTSVTTIVDRLVRRDYLTRNRTEENRRIVVLSLTDAGREVLEQILEEQRRHCEAMLAVLDPKERDQFVAQITNIAKGTARGRPDDPDIKSRD